MLEEQECVADAVPSIADLIDRLMRTHHHPTKHREYTGMEIALRTNGVIQQSHLHGLRNGRIKNPTRETLLALCEVFSVSPLYFFPELADRADLTPD